MQTAGLRVWTSIQSACHVWNWDPSPQFQYYSLLTRMNSLIVSNRCAWDWNPNLWTRFHFQYTCWGLVIHATEQLGPGPGYAGASQPQQADCAWQPEHIEYLGGCWLEVQGGGFWVFPHGGRPSEAVPWCTYKPCDTCSRGKTQVDAFYKDFLRGDRGLVIRRSPLVGLCLSGFWQ
jgi:hypothetical protein